MPDHQVKTTMREQENTWIYWYSTESMRSGPWILNTFTFQVNKQVFELLGAVEQQMRNHHPQCLGMNERIAVQQPHKTIFRARQYRYSQRNTITIRGTLCSSALAFLERSIKISHVRRSSTATQRQARKAKSNIVRHTLSLARSWIVAQHKFVHRENQGTEEVRPGHRRRWCYAIRVEKQTSWEWASKGEVEKLDRIGRDRVVSWKKLEAPPFHVSLQNSLACGKGRSRDCWQYGRRYRKAQQRDEEKMLSTCLSTMRPCVLARASSSTDDGRISCFLKFHIP